MTKRRYELLKKNVHFNNYKDIPKDCSNHSYKIKPLIDVSNKNFQQFGYFSHFY